MFIHYFFPEELVFVPVKELTEGDVKDLKTLGKHVSAITQEIDNTLAQLRSKLGEFNRPRMLKICLHEFILFRVFPYEVKVFYG